MGGFGLGSDGGGQGFGIACAGEAGDAERHAVPDDFGSLFGTHDFVAQTGVADAFCCVCHILLLR